MSLVVAPVISLESVIESLRSGVADGKWLLSEIESQGGWFRFPSFLQNLIRNLRIEAYPILYANEASMVAVCLHGFLSADEIKQLGTELEAASIEERGEFLLDLLSGVSDGFEQVQIPKTPQEQEAARQAFLAMSEEERAVSIKQAQYGISSFLAWFHQYLSVMVHGEKLTSLVTQATTGDDQAFVKAIQIDKRVLTEIPYFRERFARAQDEADSDFFDRVSYRLKTAPYRGKIRHKSLWYAFAVLEQAGWLDRLKHRELLEICDDVGVGGYDSRIESEKHLGARLREYRAFQKRGIVTTT